MNIEYSQFLNPYDILFLVTCLISIFFGIKNGIIKSLFNLIKWVIIFYLIKNCFTILRPISDPYISNQTISDILIFLFTLITSYILLSFLNRIIIGILQPKKSGLVDLSFGAILGVFRAYIIFVLLVFFFNSNFLSISLPEFFNNGNFKSLIDYGVNLLEQLPRDLENIKKIDI